MPRSDATTRHLDAAGRRNPRLSTRAAKPLAKLGLGLERDSGSVAAFGRKALVWRARGASFCGSGPVQQRARPPHRRHYSSTDAIRQGLGVLGLARRLIRKMLCRGTVLVLAALACHRGVLADVPVSPAHSVSIGCRSPSLTAAAPFTVDGPNERARSTVDLPVYSTVLQQQCPQYIAPPLHAASWPARRALQFATHACHSLRQ